LLFVLTRDKCAKSNTKFCRQLAWYRYAQRKIFCAFVSVVFVFTTRAIMFYDKYKRARVNRFVWPRRHESPTDVLLFIRLCCAACFMRMFIYSHLYRIYLHKVSVKFCDDRVTDLARSPCSHRPISRFMLARSRREMHRGCALTHAERSLKIILLSRFPNVVERFPRRFKKNY